MREGNKKERTREREGKLERQPQGSSTRSSSGQSFIWRQTEVLRARIFSVASGKLYTAIVCLLTSFGLSFKVIFFGALPTYLPTASREWHTYVKRCTVKQLVYLHTYLPTEVKHFECWCIPIFTAIKAGQDIDKASEIIFVCRRSRKSLNGPPRISGWWSSVFCSSKKAKEERDISKQFWQTVFSEKPKN